MFSVAESKTTVLFGSSTSVKKNRGTTGSVELNVPPVSDVC
jgi:hypothetical protein